MKLGTSFFGLFCILLLASCSNNKLPKITNPEALRKECIVLFQRFPSETKTNSLGHVDVISRGFVSKEKWTPAISALNPIQVVKDENGIRIFIYANKKGYSGYYVYSDQTQRKSSDLILKITNMVGIYEFEEPINSLTD